MEKIDILSRIPEILKEIPTIKVIVLTTLKQRTSHDYVNFKEILDTSDQDDKFEKFEFNQPIYILYSAVLLEHQSVLYMVLKMH